MVVFTKSIEDAISQGLSDILLAYILLPPIQLKELQAIRDLLRGEDVSAVLPTGSGECLIYQVSVRA